VRLCLPEIGAGNETRTRDLNLGKVSLYQLSYSRVREQGVNCMNAPHEVKDIVPGYRLSSGHAACRYATIEYKVAAAATSVSTTPIL
jgi:hypothetical protein